MENGLITTATATTPTITTRSRFFAEGSMLAQVKFQGISCESHLRQRQVTALSWEDFRTSRA